MPGAPRLVQENDRLQAYRTESGLPFALVATHEHRLLGGVLVRFREMESHPQFEHWLGGVCVAPDSRGRGLAAAMIEKAAGMAAAEGVGCLYLQTLRLDGGLYAELGWVPVERASSVHGEVLVMRRTLKRGE